MCVFVVKTNAHSERAPGASSLMRMLLTARLARKHEASVQCDVMVPQKHSRHSLSSQLHKFQGRYDLCTWISAEVVLVYSLVVVFQEILSISVAWWQEATFFRWKAGDLLLFLGYSQDIELRSSLFARE